MVSLLSSTKVKVTRRKTKVLTEVAIISHMGRWSAIEKRTSALLVGRKVTLTGLVLKRQPRKTIPKQPWVLTEDMHDQEQSRLCYAWGKVRDHDSLILFDIGSIHNFISMKLASKMGIYKHEIGLAPF